MSAKTCPVCSKAFSKQDQLRKHLVIHNETSVITEYEFEARVFKCLEGCNISFRIGNDLRNHLITEHLMEIEICTLNFNSFQEFQAWLKMEENNCNIKYIKQRGVKRVEDKYEKLWLDCARSGKGRRLVPEDNQKQTKKRKSRGSLKSTTGCTSQIIIVKDLTTGQCQVTYYESHYGHPEDPQHIQSLNISSNQPSITDQESMVNQDIHMKPAVTNLSNDTLLPNCFESYEELLNDAKSATLQLLSNLNSFYYTEAELEYINKQLKILIKLGSPYPPTPQELNPPRVISFTPKRQIEKSTIFSTKKRCVTEKLVANKLNFTETIVEQTLNKSPLFISDNPVNDHLY